MDRWFNLKLRRESLNEQVANKIERLMKNGSLQAGNRIPSERILSEQLHVSRPVIREATKILSARGLVSIKPGSGIYVRQPDVQDASNSLRRLFYQREKVETFHQLFEIRFVLEIEIAGLAALRARPENIKELQGCVEKMKACVDQATLFTTNDLNFHLAVAKATQNELFPILFHPIMDLLLDFRKAANFFDKNSSVEGAITHHNKILRKIINKDKEGAQKEMRKHLLQAQRLFERATIHKRVNQ